MAQLPIVIQGGMGVGISDWRLANAAARAGALGVVSGTALDQMLIRRLQAGDPGGHMRRALDHFPVTALADRIFETWFIPEGKGGTDAFRMPPMATAAPDLAYQQLCVVANFVEVWLAREGHDRPIGINYLEKIQIPHLPSIYGAMLAGVDAVLMGAGIPLKIPGVLDAYVTHESATYPLAVTGADTPTMLTFDPRAVIGGDLPPLTRPAFLAIIASDVLGLTLQRRANGRVDGFIVEGPTAGGHNAPPRGAAQFNERDEPVYGPRDVVNLEKLGALGVPFWLAGGMGTPEHVQDALRQGAAGVQVGTAFAACEESGMRADLRAQLLAHVEAGTTDVRTDAKASPTGFPFKVAQLPGTLSDLTLRAARPRTCDLGYLREAYQMADGQIGYRCPAEPPNVYVSKGGDVANTAGRACICNALVATAGLPQVRAGRHVEPPIVTIGDDLPGIRRFQSAPGEAFTAADVVRTLLHGVEPARA